VPPWWPRQRAARDRPAQAQAGQEGEASAVAAGVAGQQQSARAIRLHSPTHSLIYSSLTHQLDHSLPLSAPLSNTCRERMQLIAQAASSKGSRGGRCSRGGRAGRPRGRGGRRGRRRGRAAVAAAGRKSRKAAIRTRSLSRVHTRTLPHARTLWVAPTRPPFASHTHTHAGSACG
jgi:hypothetical protein